MPGPDHRSLHCEWLTSGPNISNVFSRRLLLGLGNSQSHFDRRQRAHSRLEPSPQQWLFLPDDEFLLQMIKDSSQEVRVKSAWRSLLIANELVELITQDSMLIPFGSSDQFGSAFSLARRFGGLSSAPSPCKMTSTTFASITPFSWWWLWAAFLCPAFCPSSSRPRRGTSSTSAR